MTGPSSSECYTIKTISERLREKTLNLIQDPKQPQKLVKMYGTDLFTGFKKLGESRWIAEKGL